MTLGLSSSGSSLMLPPAVRRMSETMRLLASRAEGRRLVGIFGWRGEGRGDREGKMFVPGVCKSLLCGMWNCIVLGGDMPSISASSSLSLSQIPP